jgi:hypothetical protein
MPRQREKIIVFPSESKPKRKPKLDYPARYSSGISPKPRIFFRKGHIPIALGSLILGLKFLLMPFTRVMIQVCVNCHVVQFFRFTTDDLAHVAEHSTSGNQIRVPVYVKQQGASDNHDRRFYCYLVEISHL